MSISYSPSISHTVPLILRSKLVLSVPALRAEKAEEGGGGPMKNARPDCSSSTSRRREERGIIALARRGREREMQGDSRAEGHMASKFK